MSRWARVVWERVPWLASLVPLVVVWEMVGRSGRYLFLPPLSRVFAAAENLAHRGTLWREGLTTLGLLAEGFAIALVAGIVLGILMGRFRRVEYLLDLYVNLFMSTPVSALVPVLILIFGLKSASIVATVVLFALFPVLINVFAGVRQTDRRLEEMARSFGASEWMVLRRVVLPSALPLILEAVRQGIGRSFNGVVLGEMLISIVGYGGLMMSYGGAFRTDFLLALILIVGGVSVTAMSAVARVERRLPHAYAARLEEAEGGHLG